jgi:hypothetical protein
MKLLTALITGLYRTPHVLRETVATLIDLRNAGILSECVVATWPSEAKAFRDALAVLDPKIVICRQPRFEVPFGNMLHQRVTLRDGLAACSGDWILKLRADTYLKSDLVRRALDVVMHEPAGQQLPLYEHRIWVPWLDYEEPFHIADEMFIGGAKDVSRLANFELQNLVEFGFPLVNLHSHAYFPDRNTYPALYFDYLAAQRDSGMLLNDDTSAKFAKLALAEKDDAFQAVLGLWYRTVFDNFECFSEPSEVSFYPRGEAVAAWYAERKPLPEYVDRIFIPELASFHNHFYIWDMRSFSHWIDTLDPDIFSSLKQSFASPGDEPANGRLLDLFSSIHASVPIGKEPYPGVVTWVRRRVRQGLRALLRAVG